MNNKDLRQESLLLLYLACKSPLPRSGIRLLFDTQAPLPLLFSLPSDGLRALGLTESLVQAMKAVPLKEALDQAEQKAAELEAKKIRFTTFLEPDWPSRVSSIPDPPCWLFYRGELPPDKVPSVSVVGSRDATTYGIRMTDYLCEYLALQGVSIVSGLAAGIDGAAHRACLRAGGKSYAVLGTGVNVCYPKEHLELFLAMAEGSGGVISEYPPGTRSLAWHFPERNRLIAAFSDCLVVAEARNEKSGSMITVGHALDQGRTVFALPGRITDPMSRGCNELIKTGAFLMNGPEDVMEQLGLRQSGSLPAGNRPRRKPDRTEQKLLRFMEEEPRSLDQLIRETGLPVGKLMEILLRLEVEGLVQQPAGGYYTACPLPARRAASSGGKAAAPRGKTVRP